MRLPETISGPVLFSLDFLILELAFKQPLKNMQQPSDLLECQEHLGAGRYIYRFANPNDAGSEDGL
jgi:hypothetical protein